MEDFSFIHIISHNIFTHTLLFLFIHAAMLASDFRKKVHVVKEADMYQYLAEDAPQYLPDETAKGQVATDELVQDFITYRKHVESA